MPDDPANIGELPPVDLAPVLAEPPSTPPSDSRSNPNAPPHEEHDAMLDVHPAHHAATSWKEFFVHIATIVLGLLIAVGLEQGVEYIHHRHQIAELQRALRIESLENRHTIQENLAATAADLKLAQLRLDALMHPQAGDSNPLRGLPPFREPAPLYPLIDVAWLGMRDSGLISTAPSQLSGNYVKIDYGIQLNNAMKGELLNAKRKIAALEKTIDSSEPLKPAKREALILAFSDYIGQINDYRDSQEIADTSLEFALQGKDITTDSVSAALARKATP